jgi:chromosome segregation ATPase
MKNFLQNLLMVLSLCLCVLVALQWHREAALRKELQKLSDGLHDEREATAGLQKRLRIAEDEVNRLGASRSEVMQMSESNRLELGALKKQLEEAGAELDHLREQTASYKSALQQANERINEQNVRLQKLADERNDAVLKYKKLVDEYTNLVKIWNEQQMALSPTNALPKK